MKIYEPNQREDRIGFPCATREKRFFKLSDKAVYSGARDWRGVDTDNYNNWPINR